MNKRAEAPTSKNQVAAAFFFFLGKSAEVNKNIQNAGVSKCVAPTVESNKRCTFFTV
jgi:hypothetical protein